MNTQHAVDAIVEARASDLGGGFIVKRALPSAKRRSVGPFVFLDQMGPVTLPPGQGLDVAPHPHIGLATVTYLFQGEILHRDSLGSVQPIRPGAVNWMTAGRGIVHSERTPQALRDRAKPVYGIQAWVALPRAHEEMQPAFAHHPADTLPLIETPGASVRVIAGSLFGARAPVATLSELFYADALLEAGAQLSLDAGCEERAVYVVEGALDIAGQTIEPGRLAALRAGVPVTLRAGTDVRIMLLGGAPLDGPRHVWWNFVSSSRERIERAKADWRAQRLGSVPGETEFIPLPGEQPPPVDYP